MIVKHFIDRLYLLKDRAIKEIRQEALPFLMFQNYLKNIRELEGIIGHAPLLYPEKEIAIM